MGRGGGTLWGGEEGHYGEGEVVINYELTRQWGLRGDRKTVHIPAPVQ